MASHSFPPSCLCLSFFSLLAIFQLAASAYIMFNCPDSNSTANSTYQSNRNKLLSNLSSAGWRTGFSIQTLGEAPDQIFGRALCLVTLNSSNCQTCLLNAIEAIKTSCSHSIKAGLWYDDCFLRYSDINSTTSEEKSWSQLVLYNKTDIPNPEKAEDVYGQLLGSLATRAANSTKMFKVDRASYTGSFTVYGLVQCIRDISPDDCYTCLQQQISQSQSTVALTWGKEGAGVVSFECYIRTDINPYFNLSLLDAPPPVLPPELPPSLPKESTDGARKRTARLLVHVLSPVAVVFLLIFVIVACLRLKKLASVADSEPSIENIRDKRFAFLDLRTLRAATSNFSEENKLGEGGFGPVYKGILASGQEIAVKRLSRNSQQGLAHLRNEVALIAKLEHKNLVKLLGCCLDGTEKLLVYEYLCNTSLDRFLFDPMRRHELGWERRYKIIEGVGRGLLYLHQDSRHRIIHRDLKASNILLDSDMNPKISDFGFARLFDMSASQGNTSHIAGTYGYMAPEYVMHGLFSEKSDVFSYGILVLEIVTGRSNSCCHLEEECVLTFSWRCWSQGDPLEAVDRSLIGQCPSQDLIRCIHIGLLCVQADPSERPRMEAVLLMLRSQSMSLPVPSAPAFLFQTASTTASQNQNNHNRSPIDAQKISVYSDMFSEMEPR